MQNFSFQARQAINLFAHHVSTLGGIQRPVDVFIPTQLPGMVDHNAPVKTDDSGLPLTSRIANAIRTTPLHLFGNRRRK